MKPCLYQCRVRGRKKWRVDFEETGKRRRKNFPDKKSAELWLANLSTKLRSAKATWAALTENERERIILAYHDAKEKGQDLFELLARAQRMPAVESKTCQDVVSELLSVKRNSGRSERYANIVEIVLNQFINGRESVRIDAVTHGDIERFLDTKKINYRPTLRSRLSMLFRFAVRRGYRVENPCERIEHVKIIRRSPEIFTAEQAVECLKHLRHHYPVGLAWFVLATFCGLRPEEAAKTTWKEINFDEDWIRVEAQTTKVRQRRVVYPKTEAMLILKQAKKLKAKLPLSFEEHRWALIRLKRVLEWERWPKDITRHTAASYWLASNGSAAHVSAMLGNSERILLRDYKALVTRNEALEFWESIGKAL